MNKIRLLLSILYILTLPIVDVLSFSALVPIPLIVGLLILATSPKIAYDKSDIFIFGAFVFTIIPYAWSYSYVGIKAILHVTALAASIVIYYFVTKTIVRTFVINGRGFLFIKCVCYSLIITSLYICVEYFLNNFTSINIDNYIPHLARVDYGALVLNGVFRARGFATESGVMAIYFEMYFFLLIGWYQLLNKGNHSALIIKLAILFSLVALLLLFSTASILVLIVGVLVIIFKEGLSLRWIVICSIIAVSMFGLFFEEIQNFIENTFLQKIAFFYSTDTVGSASERTNIYINNIKLLLDFPLGIGHGIAPEVVDSNIQYFGHNLMAGQGSLFLLFLVSGGFISMALLLVWILFKLIKCQQSALKNYITASILVIIAHYSLVSEYWLPFFWASMAIYSEISHYENMINNEKV